MSWFKSGVKSNSNLASYPEKTYRKALCTRKHCTVECEGKSDIYKFCALFLAGEKFEQKDLTDKFNYVPNRLRILMYLKIIDDPKTVDNVEYNNYLKNISSSEMGLYKKKNTSKKSVEEDSYTIEQAKYVKERIEKDKQLVIEIFKLCKKYDYKHEENIFNIYKKLGKEYNVDMNIMDLIFNLIKMPNANKDSVYTIVDYCFANLGLDEIFYSDENVENITFNDKKIEKIDDNNRFDSETLEAKIKESKNGDVDNYSQLFETSYQEIPKISNQNVNYTIEKQKELITLILKQKFNEFLIILDVAMTTNLTFSEIILQAHEFSESKSVDELVKVLGARNNTKYYEGKKKVNKKKTISSKLSYFDFLIVQNETIRAQENIKLEYEAEIAKLKQELKEQINKNG